MCIRDRYSIHKQARHTNYNRLGGVECSLPRQLSMNPITITNVLFFLVFFNTLQPVSSKRAPLIQYRPTVSLFKLSGSLIMNFSLLVSLFKRWFVSLEVLFDSKIFNFSSFRFTDSYFATVTT